MARTRNEIDTYGHARVRTAGGRVWLCHAYYQAGIFITQDQQGRWTKDTVRVKVCGWLYGSFNSGVDFSYDSNLSFATAPETFCWLEQRIKPEDLRWKVSQQVGEYLKLNPLWIKDILRDQLQRSGYGGPPEHVNHLVRCAQHWTRTYAEPLMGKSPNVETLTGEGRGGCDRDRAGD
jgi:hypothetical protein